jgi:pimeloyl-ACP methyl ester carboxylesterase
VKASIASSSELSINCSRWQYLEYDVWCYHFYVPITRQLQIAQGATLMRRFSPITRMLSAVLMMGTAAAAQTAPAADHKSDVPPIIFVHGNGDDASKWLGTIWLFESNGYPQNRLYSIRFSLPVARSDDTRDEPARSSAVDAAAELGAFVTRVLLETRSPKVVLIGSSRGGLTIRNYIQNGGGRDHVAAAILAGTPNHGVMVTDANLNNEFNGKGRYLQGLNHANSNGSEVVAGIRFLTLRSDRLDKYAQPPSAVGGVGFEGPELRGAENRVLPNLDHRELAFQPTAFAAMYTFVTGKAPATLTVTPEPKPTVSGLITGFAGTAPTNRPLAGVKLRIYPVDSADTQQPVAPLYEVVSKEDGKWGPVQISSEQEYEFDMEYQGRHVRYFKSPLRRSSSLINLRFAPPPGSLGSVPNTATGSIASQSGPELLVARPQGYFSRDRDPVLVDGKQAAAEPGGLPVNDSFVVNVPTTTPVQVSLREERITAWPSTDVKRDLPIVDFLW